MLLLILTEIFVYCLLQIMKNSSRLGKIMLVAMVHELYKSGLTEITFEKVSLFFLINLLSREPSP